VRDRWNSAMIATTLHPKRSHGSRARNRFPPRNTSSQGAWLAVRNLQLLAEQVTKGCNHPRHSGVL
jgi:hypothetical protein